MLFNYFFYVGTCYCYNNLLVLLFSKKKYIIFGSIIYDYIRGYVNKPYIHDTMTDYERVNFYTAL